MVEKFNLSKPIIVADAGLLSKKNIESLETNQYQYIIGARIKNEKAEIKKKIFEKPLKDGQFKRIKKDGENRLIITYSKQRASKDKHTRTRGLKRLEKKVKSGKLTKANINNRGYNKYLKLKGSLSVEVDYETFENDALWDGLKGYITNAKITDKQVVENYKNLWCIEKAFRMSKTDLRIRPIYHRLKNRIEAHICISFTAYSIYKELERVLYKEKSRLSIKSAAELTHNMYQIAYTLPESKHTNSILLKMDDKQAELYHIILKYY